MALVLGADYHDFAVPSDNFALVAHRFYRRSYFHFLIPPKFLRPVGALDCVRAVTRPRLIAALPRRLCKKQCFLPFACSALAAPGDPAFGQIVRAHFQLHHVPRDNADVIHAQFS